MTLAVQQAFWWLNKRRSFGKELRMKFICSSAPEFPFPPVQFLVVLFICLYNFRTCYFSLFFDSSKSVTWKVHGRSRDKIAESPKKFQSLVEVFQVDKKNLGWKDQITWLSSIFTSLIFASRKKKLSMCGGVWVFSISIICVQNWKVIFEMQKWK